MQAVQKRNEPEKRKTLFRVFDGARARLIVYNKEKRLWGEIMELTDRELKNMRRVYRMLAGCTVLLKKNGAFPLETAGELALYGNGARHTVTGGTGSGEVNSRFRICAERGLRAAGFEITTGAWMDAYDGIRRKAEQDFIQEVRRRAKANHTSVINEAMGAVMAEPEYDLPLDGDGDAAVYVLSRISGEGNDRVFEKGDFLLTDTEVKDILALNRRFERFMLVLNVGGPVDLSPVMEVGNILLLSQLGALTGRVLADILLGKQQPSGKLATTWTSAEGQQPMDFGDRDEVSYREGIYVGYRYYSTYGKDVRFPFGFGLGYTDFAVHFGGVSAEGTQVTVTAEAENTGACSGRETVQIYVSAPQGKLDKPALCLAGFGKTKTLEPGEKETVTIRFDLRDIASYDTAGACYVLEAGDYALRMGTDSERAEACAVLTLPRTVRTRQVKNALGDPGFEDMRPEEKGSFDCVRGADSAQDDSELPRILLDPAAMATEFISYNKEDPVPEEVQTLSEEELIYLSVGAHGKGGSLGTVIGSAAKTVAGAAGATPAALADKGFGELVMADGPAGIRLTPKYWKKGENAYGIGSSLVGGMEDFLSKPLTAVLKLLQKKPPKGAQILEQYATAIPIGTALAQSFDEDLARQCGDIIGEEMQEFGVHLWLAPALNIHRSIRCGRNFEYYSEDPLLSGRMAAAITKGVQAHKGCGVTIKHFAANNQETNRYQNNSRVSERAMREIYLRGFEICIREAQPAAVMTSYNLLNGVHTSERKDLLEDVLRKEFGFKGLLMTDWIVAMMQRDGGKYPPANAGRIAAAGGGMVMPGSEPDVKAIREALAAGKITKKQLQKHAARLFAVCRKLLG